MFKFIEKNLNQLFNNFHSQLHFQPLKPTNPSQPLFIYLPGMDGTGMLFHTQVTIWKHFDVRCLSMPKNDVSNWQTLTNKVLNLITQELTINPSRKIFLCGESFGGCLALKLVETAPNLFNHLILINVASSFRQRPWLNLGGIFTQFIPDFVYFNSTLILLPFLANLTKLKRSDRQELLKAMQSIPSKTVAWRISLLDNFTINENKLKFFKNLVLIIASQEDQILPSVEEAQKLSKIFLNQRIVILQNSGHSCLLEKDINLFKIIFNY